MWSSCAWVMTRPRRRLRRSAMKQGSGTMISTSGSSEPPKPMPQSTASQWPSQRYRLRFMPISPVPPSGRKARSPMESFILSVYSGSRFTRAGGLLLFDQSRALTRQCGRGVAFRQQPQALERQVGVDLLDHHGALGEQRRQAAGADDLHRAAVFGADAGDQALDHADIAPVDAGLHGGDSGAADH